MRASFFALGLLGVGLGDPALARAQEPMDEQPPPPPSPVPPAPLAAQLQPLVPKLAPPRWHGPKSSLWTGGRAGILGFGYSFFDNNKNQPESVGNFLGTGASGEFDIGVRIAKRYVPYVGLELGFHPAGHRFDGQNAHATSTFLGIGFRYSAGDVDALSFLADIAFGVRWVTVSNQTESFTMRSLELFRLGLGAEYRVSSTLVVSPLFTLSGGAMSYATGSITYSSGQGDGQKQPLYQDGANDITQQRGYLVISLGIGAHFDLFGRY